MRLTVAKPELLNLEMIRSAGIGVRTVSDEMILAALGRLVRALRVVLEPAATVGLAALLDQPSLAGPGTTGLMLSGSNVSMALLARVLGELPGHRSAAPPLAPGPANPVVGTAQGLQPSQGPHHAGSGILAPRFRPMIRNGVVTGGHAGDAWPLRHPRVDRPDVGHVNSAARYFREAADRG